MPTDNENDGDLGADDDDADPQEYDAMLRLDRLETLEEEMQELGVSSLDEVRRKIAELHRELDDE
jgi:hypothetical protein